MELIREDVRTDLWLREKHRHEKEREGKLKEANNTLKSSTFVKKACEEEVNRTVKDAQSHVSPRCRIFSNAELGGESQRFPSKCYASTVEKLQSAGSDVGVLSFSCTCSTKVILQYKFCTILNAYLIA